VTRPVDDVTVAVSQGVERAFTGTAHPPNEFTDTWCTIYNGIDIEGFGTRVANADTDGLRTALEIDPEATVYLSVGRYVTVKAQDELIAGFARAEMDNSELVLVGHGPREKALREAAKTHDVPDRVHVTGEVPAVEPYYALADAFVSASRGEGMPVTFLEAMCARLPVIGTSIPGVEEVVDDGTTGFLYPPGDVSALVTLLERLHSTDRWDEFGAAAYQRVQTSFSIERMVDAYVELYSQVSE
jgi:glycosyltransferase involved in cell wall biosynthesis